MKRFTYLLITITLIIGGWSCVESDDFSSAPDLKLTFSRDTVSFDTVFTTVGSATQVFRVYNRNNKSLRMESIEVMNPQQSGFRMNFDGESGTRLTDVDILKKDSLYGFLEVTVNPQHVNSPVLIKDSIRFVTNGNVQYLQLEAIGRDVYKWSKKTISADTTITSDKPILIYDTLRVNENVTLRIEENVELYFHDKASMHVYGTLVAKGKLNEPIIFRGDRLDNINGSIPYDYAPGLWGGITFYKDSYNNSLENVRVKNAVNGLVFLPSDIHSKKASLINTVVHNSSNNGISATNCDIDAINCQFTNARNTLLRLSGGSYSFLHCTVANYYSWSSRVMESLVLNDKDEEGAIIPLLQCDFINSIVYGSFSNELSVLVGDNSSSNYQFINCLIRNKQEFETSHYINNIWNADPKFVYSTNDGSYYYNFRLQETSSAIDKADKAYSLASPLDLDGNSRLNDANPDIGCYEWVVE